MTPENTAKKLGSFLHFFFNILKTKPFSARIFNSIAVNGELIARHKAASTINIIVMGPLI